MNPVIKLFVLVSVLVPGISAVAEISHTNIKINSESVVTEAFESENASGIRDLLSLVANRRDVTRRFEGGTSMHYFSTEIFEVMKTPNAKVSIHVSDIPGEEFSLERARNIRLVLETGLPLTNVSVFEVGTKSLISIKGPIAKRLLRILKESGAQYKHGSYSVHGTEPFYGPHGDISDIACSERSISGNPGAVCSIH